MRQARHEQGGGRMSNQDKGQDQQQDRSGMREARLLDLPRGLGSDGMRDDPAGTSRRARRAR
ncbi:hypothetical protein OR16_04002 [Cupriavidus basilensis OR16]|uniref:Uncharacterized protein n=1 Tax=Cupriavidus basilensis OR16 TaxID=1127483 RepID=H1RZQ1_9BURK|nr:hypothetical protein OR16_04002 [Cupriavidus basilensis OR16]